MGYVKPILEKDGKEVVAAKIVVYGGEDKEYCIYITRSILCII
jgi:hypothetical protein